MISAAFPYQSSGGGSSAARWRMSRLARTIPSCCCTAAPPRRTSGAGVHFVQEDSPDEIGRAIAGWIRDRVQNIGWENAAS
jgi:hypothetical protein